MNYDATLDHSQTDDVPRASSPSASPEFPPRRSEAVVSSGRSEAVVSSGGVSARLLVEEAATSAGYAQGSKNGDDHDPEAIQRSPRATVSDGFNVLEVESSEPRPLRMIHVGPSLVRAGVEVWLKSLARFLDPGRLQLVHCFATHPEHFDPVFAAELPVPAEVADGEGIQRAVADCDVLLFWGPSEMGRWLQDCRPGLSVFVAHGEGDYTRQMLAGCGPVVDHVVAVSRRVRERVAVGHPTTVIPNGVDASHLSRSLSRGDARGRFGFGPDDFVLGYVGRFSSEKQAHRVIEAVASLPRQFKALLVGWGPLHPFLLELANRLIPGRFAITVGKDCFGDYYEALDALCMVSVEEGYPLVVLEAMMCGRPVVATEVGGVPDLILDRINGLVVSGSARSIRDAALLLERYPDWARGLAIEAKKTADHQGHARRMARDYEDLIHQLWREKHARRNGSAYAIKM